MAAGIISGMFLGTSQWLILRQYISDWKWILVMGLGLASIASIQTVSDLWINSLLSPANAGSGAGISLLLVLTVILLTSIAAILIYGYLQWYVLRPYVTQARWWILIPLIAVLSGGVPLLLGFLTRGWLRFNLDVLSLTLLPTTQAIGFCLLKKKSVSQHPLLQSPLALATDIVNYWDIQRLEKILDYRISQIWKTDLRTSIGQLNYLVGVNWNGTVIAYEPMNQASADNVDQTPLPELASESSSVAWETEALKGFAKFQVVFTPPSRVQISSWRGIPLIWLGVAVYAGILGISMLCAWLQIDILHFRKSHFSFLR
ncbi:hypothetical protein [Microseira sp. BLCC-F43]|uniref:hypothetical protein n=1 Tax=Microseira sp. BLCC-F43 TaxID=3153602 RepID=UPI0035B823B3